MDLYTHFTAEYREQWINGRLLSARPYGGGTGSIATVRMGGIATGARRVATRIETWAKGSTADVSEQLVSRITSAQ